MIVAESVFDAKDDETIMVKPDGLADIDDDWPFSNVNPLSGDVTNQIIRRTIYQIIKSISDVFNATWTGGFWFNCTKLYWLIAPPLSVGANQFNTTLLLRGWDEKLATCNDGW